MPKISFIEFPDNLFIGWMQALENIPVGVRDNTRIIKALNHFPPNTQQNAHGTSSATASSVELKFMCSNCGLGGDYMKK